MRLRSAFIAASFLFPSSAMAWTWEGPICLTNSDRTVTLTLEEIDGNNISYPSEVTIEFEDNEGELEFAGTSQHIDGSISFHFRHDPSAEGVVGVRFVHASGSSSRYEFEFRADGSCSGAWIETSPHM